LDPAKRIALIVHCEICISGLRCVQVTERAEAVLEADGNDGLRVEDGLLDHQRSVVLLINSSQDKSPAVYIDEDWKLAGRGRLEAFEGYIDLEDQAFEFVGDGDERIAGRGSASGRIVGEGLGRCVAV
jgi:hypothetical protein